MDLVDPFAEESDRGDRRFGERTIARWKQGWKLALRCLEGKLLYNVENKRRV